MQPEIPKGIVNPDTLIRVCEEQGWVPGEPGDTEHYFLFARYVEEADATAVIEFFPGLNNWEDEELAELRAVYLANPQLAAPIRELDQEIRAAYVLRGQVSAKALGVGVDPNRVSENDRKKRGFELVPWDEAAPSVVHAVQDILNTVAPQEPVGE